MSLLSTPEAAFSKQECREIVPRRHFRNIDYKTAKICPKICGKCGQNLGWGRGKDSGHIEIIKERSDIYTVVCKCEFMGVNPKK